MYEHRQESLLPRNRYLVRLLRHVVAAFLLLAVSLGLGVVGFCWLGDLPWINSFVDSSMLLSGMGPVYAGDIKTVHGKMFASLYALFAGFVSYIAIGVVLLPVIHRFLHKFHCDDRADKK